MQGGLVSTQHSRLGARSDGDVIERTPRRVHPAQGVDLLKPSAHGHPRYDHLADSRPSALQEGGASSACGCIRPYCTVCTMLGLTTYCQARACVYHQGPTKPCSGSSCRPAVAQPPGCSSTARRPPQRPFRSRRPRHIPPCTVDVDVDAKRLQRPAFAGI